MQPSKANAVAIFSIFGSAASIIGLAGMYYGIENEITREVAKWVFIGSLLLSGYVLGVEKNPITKNVESKIEPRFKTYDLDASANSGNVVSVQTGQFSMKGPGTATILFHVPFLEPPDIEIINFNGLNITVVPTISNTTRFQCILNRSTGLAMGGSESWYVDDEFKWIATGNVMKELPVSDESNPSKSA